MRQPKLVLIVLAIMCLVSACSSSGTDKSMRPETPVEAPDKDPVKEYPNNDIQSQSSEEYIGKFSYIKQLSSEKQKAFTRFESGGDLQELYAFTPEDMVLIYLYCISIGDPELIYEITYNGGQLPDRDQFRNDYFEYALKYDSETAIRYRYYDSIKVDESTAEENKLTVLITVSIERVAHTLALGLQKEDQIWKLDIYPLIQDYINKASDNKAQ